MTKTQLLTKDTKQKTRQNKTQQIYNTRARKHYQSGNESNVMNGQTLP